MKRREFFRALAGAPYVLATERKAAATAPEGLRTVSADGRVRVALARDPGVWRKRSLAEEQVGELLDRAMVSAFGIDEPRRIWKSLFAPGEKVGIKVNCLSGRRMSTHQELVWAIVDRLRQVGVSAENIIIWDRLNADLEKAGYRLRFRGRGPRVYGNDHAGYDTRLYVAAEVGCLLSDVPVHQCDALINLPVLKDHGIVGVTLALKNYFGAIHNPNKYHANCGDPYVADVNLFPPLREKTRLIVCDGLEAQCEGGPPFMPQWAWKYNGLLVSTDPVALDMVGWGILEARRKEVGLPSLKDEGREPTYIRTAADAAHRLGTCDLNQITVVET